MAKTKNIGLELTENTSIPFSQYREALNGNNETSNAYLIDEEFGKVAKAKGIFINDPLNEITDKKSFYKYFYERKDINVMNYLIEGGTEQTETHQNIIDALGGLPVGFKRPSHWFINVFLEGRTDRSYTNGFYLRLLLRGSVDDDFFMMYMHSYNGANGVFDTKWLNIKGTSLTPTQLNSLLQGDDTIIVDVAEGGQKVEIHLDQIFKESLATKLDLEGKVNKVIEQEKVYATDGIGNPTTLPYNVDPYGNGLAKRTNDGRLKGATATEDNDLPTFKQLKELPMLKYRYIGDIYETEFYSWCQNTPNVVDGALFSVEVQTETPAEAIARGFPALEVGAIVYGYFFNGQVDSPVVIMTDKGNFKIIDGGTLTCEKLGGGTEVVANNGEATATDLTTLKVGNTNYAIPKGGGGGGGDFIPSKPTKKIRLNSRLDVPTYFDERDPSKKIFRLKPEYVGKGYAFIFGEYSITDWNKNQVTFEFPYDDYNTFFNYSHPSSNPPIELFFKGYEIQAGNGREIFYECKVFNSKTQKLTNNFAQSYVLQNAFLNVGCIFKNHQVCWVSAS